MSRRGPFMLAALVAALLSSSTAKASEASDLFDEGVKLLDEKKYAEACKKLERSQVLEPAAGTALNLAGCYESLGQKLRALATFKDAKEAARARQRADWQKIAEEHIAQLEKSIPTLRLEIAPNPVDLVVELDGRALTPIERGGPIRLDPGKHALVARAAEREPFRVLLSIDRSTSLAIPTLPAAGEKVGPVVGVPPPAPSNDARTAGFVVGSVGIGVLAFGVVSGLVAGGALDDAKAGCARYPDDCRPEANAPNDRAFTWSTVSTVSFIAGGALVAAGAVLVLLPGPKSPSSVGLTPSSGGLSGTLRVAF